MAYSVAHFTTSLSTTTSHLFSAFPQSLFLIRHHRKCSASTWSPPAVTDSGHYHCHILAAVLRQTSLLSAPSSPNSSYRLPLTVFTTAIHWLSFIFVSRLLSLPCPMALPPNLTIWFSCVSLDPIPYELMSTFLFTPHIILTASSMVLNGRTHTHILALGLSGLVDQKKNIYWPLWVLFPSIILHIIVRCGFHWLHSQVLQFLKVPVVWLD
jgi:hypothetical protein